MLVFSYSILTNNNGKNNNMTNRTNKKRFSAFIHAETYDKVNEFVKENELITTRLSAGSVLEMGLNIFFKEVEDRPLEEIAVEYLTRNIPANDGGVVSE